MYLYCYCLLTPPAFSHEGNQKYFDVIKEKLMINEVLSILNDLFFSRPRSSHIILIELKHSIAFIQSHSQFFGPSPNISHLEYRCRKDGNERAIFIVLYFSIVHFCKWLEKWWGVRGSGEMEIRWRDFHKRWNSTMKKESKKERVGVSEAILIAFPINW